MLSFLPLLQILRGQGSLWGPELYPKAVPLAPHFSAGSSHSTADSRATKRIGGMVGRIVRGPRAAPPEMHWRAVLLFPGMCSGQEYQRLLIPPVRKDRYLLPSTSRWDAPVLSLGGWRQGASVNTSGTQILTGFGDVKKRKHQKNGWRGGNNNYI